MNRIPVVYAADNRYVMPTVVSITSLLANKQKDTFYEIFVIENAISDESRKKFAWEQFTGEYSIDFLKLDLSVLDNPKLYGAWNPMIYAKYYICDLLRDHDKCLWLDGDTIIQSDLTELFSVDLRGLCIGAVKSPDTNYNIAAGKEWWLGMDWKKYLLKCINVGVLVMNLAELRHVGGGNYFTEETLGMLSRLPDNSKATEQDMFNKLLIGKIKYLPLKYNFYLLYVYNYYARHYYPFCFDRKTIEEAFAAPVIIHYSPKPWKYSNGFQINALPFKKFQKIWEKYYYLSPFRLVKLRRKRLNLFIILYLRLKPFLKTSPILLKIKRAVTKTRFDSPIHDFFD